MLGIMIYDLDCMRCKNKIPDEFARFSNHCEKCLGLVTEKNKEITKKIDDLRKEYEDFQNGKDINE
jgi:reverse gyrase